MSSWISSSLFLWILRSLMISSHLRRKLSWPVAMDIWSAREGEEGKKKKEA